MVYPRCTGNNCNLLARRPEPGCHIDDDRWERPRCRQGVMRHWKLLLSSKGGSEAIECRSRQYEPGRHSPSHQSFYVPPQRPPNEQRGCCQRRKGVRVPAGIYCRNPHHVPRTKGVLTTRPPGNPPGHQQAHQFPRVAGPRFIWSLSLDWDTPCEDSNF